MLARCALKIDDALLIDRWENPGNKVTTGPPVASLDNYSDE